MTAAHTHTKASEWLSLSMAAWLSGGLVLAVAYRRGWDAEARLAVLVATASVWGLAMLGLWFRNTGTITARELALTHLKLTGLRTLGTAAAAIGLVAGLQMEVRSVAVTLIAVYLSVLTIETLNVSRALKRLETTASQA